MKNIFTKLLKFIRAENKKIRLISFINKSSLRFLIKNLLNIFNYKVRSVRKNIMQKLAPTSRELEVVNQLNTHGYAQITDLMDHDLLNSLEANSKVHQQKSSMLEQEQINTNKDFWIRLTDQDFKNSLNTENIFIKFALQESVLRIVSTYLGSAAFLEYALLTLSKGTNTPLKSSQLWHRDFDNVGMLKMFVYLTDVTQTEFGPFTFINKQHSLDVKTSVFNTHIEDHKIFKFISPTEITEIKGPKLTVFIVDTSRCYHMGSRLKQGFERLMYTALFIDIPSIYPWSGFSKIKNTTPNLSELQKIAISTDSY